MTVIVSAAEIIARHRAAAVEGLNLLAERDRAIAVPLTPIQYGDLRSGHTVVPATPDELTSAVVNDLDYAVPVHEDLTARHPSGQAKYFEEAATQVEPEVEPILGAALRREFG